MSWNLPSITELLIILKESIQTQKGMDILPSITRTWQGQGRWFKKLTEKCSLQPHNQIISIPISTGSAPQCIPILLDHIMLSFIINNPLCFHREVRLRGHGGRRGHGQRREGLLRLRVLQRVPLHRLRPLLHHQGLTKSLSFQLPHSLYCFDTGKALNQM